MSIPSLFLSLIFVATCASAASAETRIRILPPSGSTLAVDQRIDIYVEASSTGGTSPSGLRVTVNGSDVTARNAAAASPAGVAVFVLRGFSMPKAGELAIDAVTADGTRASARLPVLDWRRGAAARPRARNVILLLGDGMGAAHRTAARVLARGIENGRARGRLAMDDLEVTGMVMTASLNALVTDSSPGMAAYVTGQKGNNNQQGVFPDRTADAFDNPRVEYLGEMLRRVRGPGFNVGIVTTSDVTDSTPAANAVHTSDRYAGDGIASRFLDERAANGVTVLLGGGARHFRPKSAGGTRADDRDLVNGFRQAGYDFVTTGAEVQARLAAPRPAGRMLGLFHSHHMPVAFDKVGAGRYSTELERPEQAPYRDTPMLDDLAQLALRSLEAHSPGGFYLMVEGASIDKRAHAADSERAIWDVIEFDRAVAVALEFARRTNGDKDPANDTLVIVTADHECGGLALIGVGNERYAPKVIGKSVRDYATGLRFAPEQLLQLNPNYAVDANGYPVDPDPTRKLILGWAAAPDRYENWLANPRQLEAAVTPKNGAAVANEQRDGPGDPFPGFLVPGIMENGATACPSPDGCPADTASVAQTSGGHTATDVPLSASGPGAWQFSGVYENTDVFLKILRATAGTYGDRR